jgi:hypothetical protein
VPREAGLFLVATFATSWTLWGLAHPLVGRHLESALPPEVLVMLGTAMPGVVALILAAARGRAGPLLGGLVAWRVRPAWYAVALLGPPAIMVVATGIHVLLGGELPTYPPAARWPLVLVNFAVVLLLGGPLGEEPGWRGYALPMLRETHGLLPASLVLGIAWAGWHLPLFLLPGTPQADLPLSWFALQAVALAVLLALVYEGTGGSLLLPMLLHASVNTFSGPLRIIPADGGSTRPFVITALLAWLAAGLVWAVTRRG